MSYRASTIRHPELVTGRWRATFALRATVDILRLSSCSLACHPSLAEGEPEVHLRAVGATVDNLRMLVT